MQWLNDIIDPLNNVVFVFGNDHVSWAEILGFITGVADVWLCAKARISNFPVGILNAFFFLVLFATAHLWADSALQIMYIVLGFVGWWQWIYGGPERTKLKILHTPRWVYPISIGFIGCATWELTVLLAFVHDIAPFWDALTTSLSVVAQVLLNWKKIPNWFYWMAADLIYIPLYFYKRLDLTGIVYVLFLSMCFVGLNHWRHVKAEQGIPQLVVSA